MVLDVMLADMKGFEVAQRLAQLWRQGGAGALAGAAGGGASGTG